jgi:uroporphyrin-3 C-methyltransferase
LDDSATATPTKRRVPALAVVVFVLAVLGLLGWRAWVEWQAHQARLQAVAQQSEQRVQALEQRIEAVRRDQRAQTQRIQDAASTNRVLRDEVLGLSQRNALLEESVAELANATLAGPQALRLDEVELLLGQGLQRLAVARDVEGARRAFALAAGVLEGVDDPGMLNLRQALAQERAALEALGSGPQAAIQARLHAFSNALPALQRRSAESTAPRPAWQRALAPLVDVRPARDDTVIAPGERAAGAAALQIELSLARAALERGDPRDFRTALDRVDAWLQRLWPDGASRRKLRSELAWMRSAPLQPAVPELGTTLEQLRILRSAAPAEPGNRLPPVALPGQDPAETGTNR